MPGCWHRRRLHMTKLRMILIALVGCALVTGACGRRKHEKEHQEPPTTTTKPIEPSPTSAQAGSPTPQAGTTGPTEKKLDKEQLANKYKDCVTLVNTAQFAA